jgi:hypothetical protein
MMAQSQFSADMQRYKADLSSTTTAQNATAYDKEFRKIRSDLIKSYVSAAESRLDYIQNKGSTPAAIREGYRLFPVPEYNPDTGSWTSAPKKSLGNILGK